jgi:hypothetical protein
MRSDLVFWGTCPDLEPVSAFQAGVQGDAQPSQAKYSVGGYNERCARVFTSRESDR